MLYQILSSLSSLRCRLGFHRWSSRARYRLLSMRKVIAVDVCTACPSRRVRQIAAGGAS